MKSIFNRSGSTLVMVLVAVGLVSLMMMAAIRTTSFVDKDAQRTASSARFDTFGQAVTALLSNPKTCLNGLAGLQGLQFSGGTFNSDTAATKAGQDVTFGSHLADASGNPATLANGVVIPSMQLKITHMYLTNPVQIADQPPKTYSVALMASMESTAADHQIMNSRAVANLTLQVDPSSGALLGCSSNISAAGMCAAMQCNYNAAAADQKCVCPFPDVSCPSGQMVGIGTDGNAICRDFNVNCPPGAFLTGFDSVGQPVCQVVQAKAAAIGNCHVRLCTVPSDPSTCWLFDGNMRMDDCYNQFLMSGNPNGFQEYFSGDHNCPGLPNTFGGPYPTGGVFVAWYPPTGVTCTIHGEEQNDQQCAMPGAYMHNVYTCSDGDNGWWDILGWCSGHSAGQSCMTEVPVNTPCPPGTDGMGLGAAVSANCNCLAAGSTWTGSACVGGNPCPPGASLSGQGGAVGLAPSCKCTNPGSTWAGSKCVP